VLPFSWQRRRLWAEPRHAAAAHDNAPSLADEPAVRDHVTGGIPTAPAALLVDRALDALSRVHGPVDLVDIVVERPLRASVDVPRAALTLGIDEDGEDDAGQVRVRTRASDAVHLSARHERARGRTHTSLDLDALRARMTTVVSGAEIYARLDRTGFVMGPSMRAVDSVLRGERELLATLRAPPGGTRGRLVDPALLDGASHAVAAFFLDAPGAHMFLGFSIEAVRVFSGVHDACLAYVRLKSALKDNVPTLRYDIVLTSDAGEVLCEVEDFAARRVELRGAAEDAKLTAVTVPPLTVPPTRVSMLPGLADEGLRARLITLVRRMVAERLRRGPDAIPEHGPLARLGVDSLLAVELVRKLEARLGIKLHATLLFEAPTVAAVVDRVLRLARERGVTLALEEDSP
jgi:acyl carrier protein